MQQKLRKTIQIIYSIFTNINIKGFFTGFIYTGKLKNICIPTINCYSCPGALFACPIGSIQSFFTSRKIKFPFFIIGFLLLIGILFGRFVCGWLCLFGFIQEILFKIKTKKISISKKVNNKLIYIKYIILFIFVFTLPIFVRDKFNISYPYFCKFICPAGMLEGGIPLLLVNKYMRSAAGFLYKWKLFILIMMLLSSIFIYRPFCKYFCPLGAIYGLLQKINIFNINVDKNKCVNCNICNKTCKMSVDITNNKNYSECIKCGECIDICPQNAISFIKKNNMIKAKLDYT